MPNVRILTPELAKKAAIELNEKPEDYEYFLSSLREWLKLQTHLNARLDDQFLLAFLRAAKFSLEKAKQKLENFYTFRASMPELFSDRDICEVNVEIIIRSGCLVYLPEPVATCGARVFMMRLNCFDLSKYTLVEIMRVCFMAVDIMLNYDDNAVISGFYVVMDLSNMPKALIYKFDPNLIRKLITIFNKNIFPSRFKGFHYINATPVFEKLFNMIKSAISAKISDRFVVHSRFATLYTHIPQSILTKEYGGPHNISDLQNALWNKIYENRDYILTENTYGLTGAVDREKLDKVFDNVGTSFGIDGSFRKLNID